MKTSKFLLIILMVIAIIIMILAAGMIFPEKKTIEIYLNNEDVHCYYASKIN